jgi:hypothetical protein
MAKVRIRKAGPGEQAGYYNKTAMFLKKAQMGQEVQSEDTQGQSEQEMTQAYYQYAEEQLSNEVAPDRVYNALVSNGLPESVAYEMITALMDKLVDDGVINPDYKRNKEDEAAEEQKQDPSQGGTDGSEQSIEEDWKENLGPNADQQAEDQSMYEEDQAAADAEEDYLQDRSYMQDGGYTQDDVDGQNNMMDQYNEVKDNTTEQFDLDTLISKTPGIQPGLNFPSLSEYIPDYQNLQWSNMDALQSSQTDENSQPDLESQRVGGMVKKKQFVKNVMSLLKKQTGGDNMEQPEDEEDKDPTLGKGNPMDTITEDVQKHKNNFLNSIKTKATTVKTEEMYDKLKQSNDPALQQLGMQQQQQPQQPFQVGGMTGGQDPLFRFFGGGDQDFQEDPNYYEADFLPEASYGYSTGNLRRAKEGDTGKSKMNIDPGFTINPATGKPFTREEWTKTSADSKATIDDATKGMSKRQREAWVQQQLLLRQQQQQPRVNAQGVPIASVNYVPRYISGPGSWSRSLTPWNPIIQSQRFTSQMGNPYMYGTNTPYIDPLTGMKPIARQVTKKGLLGRPKRYTDIYSIPGSQEAQGDGNIIADGNTLIFPERNSKGSAYLTLLDNPHGDNIERQRSNVEGLNFGSKRAIRQGERQTARQLARGEEQELNAFDDNFDPYAGFPLDHPIRNNSINASETEPSEIIDVEYDINGNPISPTSTTTTSPRVGPNGRPMGNTAYEDRMRREGPSQEKLDELYSRDVMEEQRYGGIHRFIPKADTGLTINNPNLPQPAPANPDFAVSNQPGLIGQVTQGPNSVWSQQQSFNAPAPTSQAVESYNNASMNNMAVEPAGDDLADCTEEQKKDPTSKCYQAGQKNSFVGVDFSNRKSTTIDPEAGVNVFNAGVRGVTGLLNRKDEKRKERQMYDNLTSDNLYAAQGTKHRGDWVDIGSQMGQYRFDQMGQDRSGFSSYGKYGGYMQDGGELDYLSEGAFPMMDSESGYNEGDEVYMTDDDIKNFMASGGQIEYIK